MSFGQALTLPSFSTMVGRIVICSGRGFTHWRSRWHLQCDRAATEMQRAENRQHLQSNTHGWHLKYSMQHFGNPSQRLNIEHTYTAHASFHTALDIYVMAVGHNNTTVDKIQYAAHSTISTREHHHARLKFITRRLKIHHSFQILILVIVDCPRHHHCHRVVKMIIIVNV